MKHISEIQLFSPRVDSASLIADKKPISVRLLGIPFGSKKKRWSIDFLSLLQYQEHIAGCAVMENSLIYALYALTPEGVLPHVLGEQVLQAGTIVDGMLYDKQQYTLSLQQLIFSISGTHASSVILSLPPHHIWMTTLEFPHALDTKSLNEAINLYFEFSLPFSQKESYTDWEIMRSENSSGVQRVILGAVRKRHIDPYLEIFKKEGVTAIAVESHLMSAAHCFGDGRILFIIVYPSGAHIGAYAGSVFRFQRFVSWNHMKQKKEENEDPIPALCDEIRNTIHFLRTETHAPFQTEKIILIASQDFRNSFNEYIAADPLSRLLDNAGEEISNPGQIIARGAAFRGLLPRRDDTIMSFTDVGTEKIYEWKRAVSFSAFFEKLSVGLGIFFILLYAGSLFFVKTLAMRVQNRQIAQGAISQDIINIQDETKRFNQTVETITKLSQRAPRWEKLFAHIHRIANPGITITSLSVSDLSKIEITGVAVNREALLQFKAVMNSSGIFHDITLPFTLLITKEKLPFRFILTLRDNAFLLTP